ncbi:MAG: CDP-6-deoxy-delta-3,4-glucoseen reductase [Gammaproteobacteria bacterium]
MTYKVTIQPTGHEFEVNDNETVLDAAMRHSIELPYGCRGGACGSCAGFLLKGEIKYERQPVGLKDDMISEKKALFCKAIPVSDLEISIEELEGSQGIEVKTLRCRVEQKNQLNHDVMQVKLKLAGDDRLQFLAGQYLEFILQGGKRRAFSIANAPHDDELIELHIRHVEGGKFTDFLFNEMEDRAMLKIEGPLGSFYLREESLRPIIMMGGGTGFGPLKGMIEHANYVKLKRPIHLFVGVRSLRDLYMDEMVKQWLRVNPLIQYTPVLSEPLVEDNWQGETGFVHDAVARSYADLSDQEIYMSGPPVMITAAVELFSQQSADRNHIYSDAFEFSADAQKALAQLKSS